MKVDLIGKPIESYKKFHKRGVLIDAGPLMLMFYGDFDKNNKTDYLKKIDYNFEHYKALIKFIEGTPTSRFVITPHIFHELYKHAQKHFDNRLKEFFNNCFNLLINMEEEPIAKDVIISHDLFIELELGEHSLICVCEGKNPHILLHDDSKICGKLQQNREILTICLKEDVMPWYWNNL